MTRMPLSSEIQVHQGHAAMAADPDWTGTIEQFWENNPGMTYGEINDMRADLSAYGYHRIGGGAAGCFTVCTPHFARLHSAGLVNGGAS